MSTPSSGVPNPALCNRKNTRRGLLQALSDPCLSVRKRGARRGSSVVKRHPSTEPAEIGLKDSFEGRPGCKVKQRKGQRTEHGTGDDLAGNCSCLSREGVVEDKNTKCNRYQRQQNRQSAEYSRIQDDPFPQAEAINRCPAGYAWRGTGQDTG